MRKVVLGILLTGALVSFGLAGFNSNNLEVRFGLGLAYWNGGEFNRALRGGNDYNREVLTYLEGTYKPLGLGYGFSAEAVYWLSPRIGVGLGLGYARASVGKHSIVGKDYGIETVLTYRASAMPVKPSFHYGFPLGDKSFVDFFFGPAFTFGCFHFWKNLSVKPDEYETTFEFNAKSSALGFHGGVGIDYKLSDSLRLFGAVKAEVTSLKNLKDEWTSEVRTSSGSVSTKGTGTLWAYDYRPNGTTYQFWGFGSSEPSAPGISNIRKGSIGGPAFGMELGIKYKF